MSKLPEKYRYCQGCGQVLVLKGNFRIMWNVCDSCAKQTKLERAEVEADEKEVILSDEDWSMNMGDSGKEDGE